ncbi:lysozyme inhibitor LprI family protein [Psychrosphaera haliotis]|uniref:DUF1311 domain-containing protein n=2 Tax=Psychrosphaera haliotis TaxID=555083 RepID=A0A6N8F6Z9_9GAMM|nr:lysozyme inhibitor LprI family protein [Psychrosphaera haliotis]MDB2373942.1 lysozyme inhibitor LprI family protein [Psychrosphaera haliotis]MUH71924.1 DUF1311 domain-containing protein [Psychrosphaera haliotis]
MLIRLFIFCFSLSLSMLVSAEESFFYSSKEITDCKQKHKRPMDYTLCLDAAFVQVERELMTWETNVEIILRDLNKEETGNNPLLLYKSSIRYFNKYKKATCKWQYIAMLPDVSSSISMAKECEIYMTKDRISKLKELSKLNF